MTRRRRLTIAALLLWTFVVTILRGVQSPNEFAETHWLIDYRLGFTRRALVGSLVTLLTGGKPTLQLIDGLSCAAFALFCLAMFALSLRVLDRANGRPRQFS